MRPLGTQVIADFYECDPARLDNSEGIREALLEAARRAEAHVVSHTIHRFNPHGVSGMVIIAESHIAIHTWPEHGYAAVDLFTCSDAVRLEECLAYFREALGSGRDTTTTVQRGMQRLPAVVDG